MALAENFTLLYLLTANFSIFGHEKFTAVTMTDVLH